MSRTLGDLARPIIAASLACATLMGAGAAVADDGYYHEFSRAQSREHHHQWSLDATRARDAWQITRGAGVRVALVDSGVGPTWELAGKVAGSVNLAGPTTPRIDVVDHGTAVSCLIAARSDVPGWRGITGMAPGARLTSVRVFGDYKAPLRRVVRGIRVAVDSGAKVLNISWEEKDRPILRSAIRYALARGVIVVAGAGNERQSGSPVQYPAAYPGVIAVGAVDQQMELASFSNVGHYVDVVAPGVDVLSCDPFGTLSHYSGTSFATPIVAGTVALMKAAHPRLTAAQAQRILRATARDLGAPGADSHFGAGLVNAARAVRAAKHL